MSTADRFRQAIVASDHDTLGSLLAKDIQVFGPVVPEPVRGIRAARAVLWAALSRLDGIHYVGQFAGCVEDVETHVLRFVRSCAAM